MTATTPKLPRSATLPVSEIEEDPNQPRKRFSEASLEELATNIEDTAAGGKRPWLEGLLHPVVVYPNPGWAEGSDAPRYRLLVGARRLRSYRLRSWPEIPARVVESPVSEARSIMTQLNENRGREDTSLLEEALAVARAFEAWRAEQPGGKGKGKDFAEKFNRSPSWVSRHLAAARARGLALQALKEERINHLEAFRLFSRLPIEAQRSLLSRARGRRTTITASTVRDALAKLKGGPGTKGAGREKQDTGDLQSRQRGDAGADEPSGKSGRDREAAGSRAAAEGTPDASAQGTSAGEKQTKPIGPGAKRRSRAPVEVRLTYAELRHLLTALGTSPPAAEAELESAFLTALERSATAT